MRQGLLLNGALVLVAAGLCRAQGPSPDYDQPVRSRPAVVPPALQEPFAGLPSAAGPTASTQPAGEPAGYRYYGGAEALLLWMKPAAAPPLVSTGPLSTPDSSVLLDHGVLDGEEHPGLRVVLGRWLDGSQHVGLEGALVYLCQRDGTFTALSGGTPSLVVPFFNPATGAEDALPVAAPGVAAGRVTVEEVSRLWSGEVNLRRELHRGPWHHVDVLAGVRALGFDENLNESAVSQAAAGGGFAAADSFAVRNLFVGGQLGVEADIHAGRWYADGWAKFALGDNHEVVNVTGTTQVLSAAGTLSSAEGGLFALPGGLGRQGHDELAFVPHAGLQVGYQAAHHFRLFAGYELLYLGNFARPGDQIDRSANPAQTLNPAAAPARPPLPIQQSDVWVQGISAGFEFRY